MPPVQATVNLVTISACFCWLIWDQLFLQEGRVSAHAYLNSTQSDDHEYRTMLHIQDDIANIHQHEPELTHLPTPAQIPDINLNEHLWDDLEHRISQHLQMPGMNASCNDGYVTYASLCYTTL